MKKAYLLSFLVALTTIISVSCGSKREPGRIYMPDMAYSRAFEAYAPNNLRNEGIMYDASPVAGTIRRGDLFTYTLPNDSNGYRMSASVVDPLPPIDSLSMKEAERLFHINCAICHGANLDAQGPLAVSGKVGGIANLKLDQYKKMAPGTMFHVVTYGKGNMGSYASQLDRKQRWMVVQYIKSQQAGEPAAADSTSAGTASATTAKAAPDSVMKK